MINVAMCGRYALLPDRRQIASMFDVAAEDLDEARYNIAPTQDIPIIRQDSLHNREMVRARWGLIPHWAKDPRDLKASMINARAETVAAKPAYRAAFRQRRCLVPALGFYEWKKEGRSKQPYFVCRKDRQLLAFAGLWDRWSGNGDVIDSCTIITTEANDLVRTIHDRMPVILSPEDFELWLESDVQDLARLQALLMPYPAEELDAYPVARTVGNPRAQGPELVEPVH